MPFYKREGDELLSGNSVYSPTVTLLAAEHEQHTYPQDGWYWFDTLDQALEGLPRTAVESVTMRQARLALLGIGKLEDVDAAINLMPSPYKEAALIEWNHTAVVLKASPLVAQLAPALGLSEADIDNLFAYAATL